MFPSTSSLKLPPLRDTSLRPRDLRGDLAIPPFQPRGIARARPPVPSRDRFRRARGIQNLLRRTALRRG
jgi:hypothetical protein